MSSALSERGLLHRIARELDSPSLGLQNVSAGEVPASERDGLRPTAYQLRTSLSPIKRQAWLRNAVQRLGPSCHLVRFGRGQTYKAVIGSRVFTGTFSEVFDQVAPLALRLLDPCL